MSLPPHAYWFVSHSPASPMSVGAAAVYLHTAVHCARTNKSCITASCPVSWMLPREGTSRWSSGCCLRKVILLPHWCYTVVTLVLHCTVMTVRLSSFHFCTLLHSRTPHPHTVRPPSAPSPAVFTQATVDCLATTAPTYVYYVCKSPSTLHQKALRNNKPSTLRST